MKMRAVRCGFMILAVTLAAGMAGCGYTTRSMLSGEYRTIYVQPFVNKIELVKEQYTGNNYRLYKPQLETDITRAVNDKYLFDGNLKPVSKETADLFLEGELVEFRRDALRYDDNDNVSEYRISIRVNLKLINQRTLDVLWEEKNFAGEKTYFTPGNQASISDQQAVNEAIADLARRVVERTVEQW